MAFSRKFVKKQISTLSPIAEKASLDFTRRAQSYIGSLMSVSSRKKVSFEEEAVFGMKCAMAIPKQKSFEGVVLYIHGGGFCCGDLSYAKGFAATLANKCGVDCYTFEYRLAPEHPFPAALDDCVSAYKRLLQRGFLGSEIVLAGESAGGGLCFSLCMRLSELGIEPPCGIIAISPWTDLTLSGGSYIENKKKEVAISKAQLDFYAKSYTKDREHPLVSPLFASALHMPPSIIFAGGDEIMLDDAKEMHKKLLDNRCESELAVAPELWHAYLMYNTKENAQDFEKINSFLSNRLKPARERMWLRLDNAAKIYPAARSRSWSNLFRLSATLYDDVDIEILKTALAVTVRRFPSVSVRLSFGMFWYYVEELNSPPDISDEAGHPVENMSFSNIHKCAFRVLVYGKRIAVEFFHSITDGTGGMIFLKSLLAEYASRKYGEEIPNTCGILDRRGEVSNEELEDSFLKHAGNAALSRRESNAYHLKGTKEGYGFVHALTFIAEADDIKSLAKERGVSVTAFLCSVMMKAIIDIQQNEEKSAKRHKPAKVLLPVNLRKIFGSETLRNFALYITPEIDPRFGEYSLDEICRSVHHQMGAELTANRMRARITRNVNDEKSFIVKIMPLFIKNIVMKSVFNAVGERKSCLTLSNLGVVELPQELSKYIERFDFTLNVPASTHHNCGMLSFGGKTYISFVRNIKEAKLELRFHEILRDLGVRLKVESNR